MTKSRGVHIVPIADLRPHDDSGRPCWCGPRVEAIDPQTGAPYPHGPLVIHHAADGRDLVEAHGIQ